MDIWNIVVVVWMPYELLKIADYILSHRDARSKWDSQRQQKLKKTKMYVSLCECLCLTI